MLRSIESSAEMARTPLRWVARVTFCAAALAMNVTSQTSAEQVAVAVEVGLLQGLADASQEALRAVANPARDEKPSERRRNVRALLDDPAALASLEVVLDRRLGVLERRYAEALDAPVRAAYRARLMSLDDAALREVARVRRVWRNYVLQPSTQLHFQQHFLMPATKVCEQLFPDVAACATKGSKRLLGVLRELNGYRDEVRALLALGVDPTEGKTSPTGIPMPPLTQPRSYDEHLDHLHRTIAVASSAAPREARDVLYGNADKARFIDKEEAEFVLYSNEVRAVVGVVAWSTDVLACAATRDHSKDRVDGNASGHMSSLPGKRGFTDRLRRFGTSASSEGAGGGSSGRNYLYQLSYGGGHTGPLYSMKRNRVGAGRYQSCYTSVYAGQKDLFHRCQASAGELFMPPGVELSELTAASVQDLYHAQVFENYGGALELVGSARPETKMDKFVRRYFEAALEVEADWHVACIEHYLAVGDLHAVAKRIERARGEFGDALDKRLRPFEKKFATRAGRAALAAGAAFAAAAAAGDERALRAVITEHPKTVYASAAQRYFTSESGKRPDPYVWFFEADRYLARFEYATAH